eukprot:2949918-Alexandrium_andersonii.AAC.1
MAGRACRRRSNCARADLTRLPLSEGSTDGEVPENTPTTSRPAAFRPTLLADHPKVHMLEVHPDVLRRQPRVLR